MPPGAGYDLDSVATVRNPPSQFDFDRSTLVVRRSESSPSSDVISFDAEVHDGWDITGNANGGYLLALVGRALAQATGRPDCMTISCHYLAPCPAGPVVIDVVPVRAGRRFATATATMWRDVDGVRRPIAQVLATLGDLENEPEGVTSMASGPPEMAEFDECIELGATSVVDFAHLHGRLATRAHPQDVGFREGRRSGRALMRGWFAFRDERPIDSLALLLVSDAFPPAVFNLDISTNWVPTVELTVHVRAIPAPGPVQCSFHTRFLQNGLLEEDGEMWDSTGVLVAQSRQLALAPRPD